MIAKKHQKTTHKSIIIRDIPRAEKLGQIKYDILHERKPHELATARRMIKFGCDVVFIKESKMTGVRSSDCLWLEGKRWEMKAIFGHEAETVQRALKTASGQSHDIVIDSTRSKRDIRRVAHDIISYYSKRSRGAKNKRILIIDHDKYCILDETVLL